VLLCLPRLPLSRLLREANGCGRTSPNRASWKKKSRPSGIRWLRVALAPDGDQVAGDSRDVVVLRGAHQGIMALMMMVVEGLVYVKRASFAASSLLDTRDLRPSRDDELRGEGFLRPHGDRGVWMRPPPDQFVKGVVLSFF